MNHISRSLSICLALALVIGLALPAAAEDDVKPRKVVTESRLVLEELMAFDETSIPEDMLRKCAGIMIFPSVIKGGFIVGGTFGRGVVLSRQGGKWSPPAFVDFGGGSFGFQIGLQSIDLIMVFRTKRGLNALLSSKVKLGGDIGVAAGPVGRRMEASTDLQLKAEVLSYSRTKGLFAGFSLEGSGVVVNDGLAEKYYGDKWTVDDIIFHGKAAAPATAKDLMKVLVKYSK